MTAPWIVSKTQGFDRRLKNVLSFVDLIFFSIAVNTPAGFYAGSIVASLNPALTIAARSMVSQCVEVGEVGRILSVFTFCSAVSSSLCTALFQKIYSLTLDKFAGAYLVINCGIYILSIPNNCMLKYKL